VTKSRMYGNGICTIADTIKIRNGQLSLPVSAMFFFMRSP
jgi:hypothetical protein